MTAASIWLAASQVRASRDTPSDSLGHFVQHLPVQICFWIGVHFESIIFRMEHFAGTGICATMFILFVVRVPAGSLQTLNHRMFGHLSRATQPTHTPHSPPYACPLTPQPSHAPHPPPHARPSPSPPGRTWSHIALRLSGPSPPLSALVGWYSFVLGFKTSCVTIRIGIAAPRITYNPLSVSSP